MKSIELARALAAAMSLRLPGTVGKIANKMRYIDSKAPLFVRGGIIRSIESRSGSSASTRSESPRRAEACPRWVAFSTAPRRFAMISSCLATRSRRGFQDSRVDINDMNFLDASERLAWKEYILVYRLLADLMDSDARPDVIFVDIPLLVPRADQSLSLAEPDVEEEWRELLEVMEGFWQRYLPSDLSRTTRRARSSCPFSPAGSQRGGPQRAPREGRRLVPRRPISTEAARPRAEASGCSSGGSASSASSAERCAQGTGRRPTTTKRWGDR